MFNKVKIQADLDHKTEKKLLKMIDKLLVVKYDEMIQLSAYFSTLINLRKYDKKMQKIDDFKLTV